MYSEALSASSSPCPGWTSVTLYFVCTVRRLAEPHAASSAARRATARDKGARTATLEDGCSTYVVVVVVRTRREAEAVSPSTLLRRRATLT